ncbi:hypothetical protein HanIR_Chr09g0422051 [Helianthus annuus]|nr:hypothetical protein HanIR_Chr09g0422051 [Helianthus annuus]
MLSYLPLFILFSSFKPICHLCVNTSHAILVLLRVNTCSVVRFFMCILNIFHYVSVLVLLSYPLCTVLDVHSYVFTLVFVFL